MQGKIYEERWFELFARRLTRRDLLRLGRDAAACIALSAVVPPSSRVLRRSRLRANPFASGVASGDPLDTGVVVWTRLDPAALEGSGLIGSAAGRAAAPIEVRWEIAEDDAFRRIARRGSASALSELGYSVHAEVDGLRPGREYWYRFDAGGEASPIGRTRTAPAPRSLPDQLRFAFASCQNYEYGFFTAHRHMSEEPLDLVVHLGDYIYERRFPRIPVRLHEGVEEVRSLAEYRARYAQYRADADLQAAHAACPWIVTNDDHEVANNFAGAISEDDAPPAEFLLRRAAAYQTYYEFMPLRRSSLPRGPDIQLFRRLDFGALLQIHVLDTRQFRSDQACGDGVKPRCAATLDAARTMLGDTQEAWLMAGLRAAAAKWNVLANQVMMAPAAGGSEDDPTYRLDTWAGYVPARNRLLSSIAASQASNPIVITGDIHLSWVAELKTDFDDPSSPVMGVEFVGTSLTSGGDGNDSNGEEQIRRNPHMKFFNSRRGYVLCTVTPAGWTSDYRTVPFVSRPGAPIETKARFVVESGKPGVERG